MKVLLLSPLPKIDPACGDVTYTQTLLDNPPAGVEYESYTDAIARGALIEHGKRRSLARAIREGDGLGRELALAAASAPLNRARRARWLFWEPFRFFSVREGEYDAIHMHVFSARFFDLDCPLVVSNAAAHRFLYSEARRYSRRRVDVMEAVDLALGKAMGVNVNTYHLPQATRVISMTHYFKRWCLSRQLAPSNTIDVVPFFLPSAPSAPSKPRPWHVGFTALEFSAKGGPTVLKAFDQVRTVRPDARLTIVGSPPQIDDAQAESRGIHWLGRVPRERLLGELLPSFDVLAYPTGFDGMPFVVLEALSRGVPVAASDYQALPEMLGHGRAGLVSAVGDADALAHNILALLEPQANAHFRRQAREHFETHYSADVVRPQLLRTYERAIAGQLRTENDVGLEPPWRHGRDPAAAVKSEGRTGKHRHVRRP